MAKGWLFFLLTLFSVLTQAFAQTNPFKNTSFETVAHIVKTQHPTDLAQVLKALPPEFMSSYTLVFDSGSSQDASLVNPRAIVFGRSAKFILAFNGDFSQEGYQRLEMMQFRDADMHYELREITFDQQGATISTKNPPQCLSCHGDVPHPIWQSYNIWPGVFGSIDDDIGAADQDAQFANFVSAASSHPRYKYLHARPDISNQWPYRDGGDYYHVYRPNDRLGRLLGGRSVLSANSLLKSSSFFNTHKNVVLYHFLRCDASQAPEPYFSTIDKLFQQRFPAGDFPNLYQNLATVMDPHYRATLELEKLILDSDVLSWNLSLGFGANGDRFSPDGFDMQDAKDYADSGYSDIDDLLSVRILGGMSAQNPALKPFFKPITTVENFTFINGSDTGIYLTKWGINKLYDSVNRFMDYKLARSACASIENQALQELAP